MLKNVKIFYQTIKLNFSELVYINKKIWVKNPDFNKRFI